MDNDFLVDRGVLNLDLRIQSRRMRREDREVEGTGM